MKRSGLSVLTALMLVFVVSMIAVAQESKKQQQQQKPPAEVKKRVPSLSTEDVLGDRAAASTVDETGSNAAKPAAGSTEEKENVSRDEAAWRDAVKEARKRAESLQRQADDAELSITRLRNQLSAPGQTPDDRNQILQQIEDAGQNAESLRGQAQQAKSELERILQEGSGKGYTEAEGPAPTKDGEPNEDYYRTKYTELLQKMQDAQRQVQLYDDRVKEINLQINNNSRSGDNFYIGKLQQQADEARQSLANAQDSLAKAQQAIEDLKEQARQAGVPPGVFREVGQ